jgi:hypothetical protein
MDDQHRAFGFVERGVGGDIAFEGLVTDGVGCVSPTISAAAGEAMRAVEAASAARVRFASCVLSVEETENANEVERWWFPASGATFGRLIRC